MIDDEGRIAPAIGGGYLPNNPLSIKMKGSEKEITVPPLEAIARNSLSILTASMKNDGVSKLVRDMQSLDLAQEIPAKDTPGLNTVFVFEDGIYLGKEVTAMKVQKLLILLLSHLCYKFFFQVIRDISVRLIE